MDLYYKFLTGALSVPKKKKKSFKETKVTRGQETADDRSLHYLRIKLRSSMNAEHPQSAQREECSCRKQRQKHAYPEKTHVQRH